MYSTVINTWGWGGGRLEPRRRGKNAEVFFRLYVSMLPPVSPPLKSLRITEQAWRGALGLKEIELQSLKHLQILQHQESLTKQISRFFTSRTSHLWCVILLSGSVTIREQLALKCRLGNETFTGSCCVSQWMLRNLSEPPLEKRHLCL